MRNTQNKEPFPLTKQIDEIKNMLDDIRVQDEDESKENKIYSQENDSFEEKANDTDVNEEKKDEREAKVSTSSTQDSISNTTEHKNSFLSNTQQNRKKNKNKKLGKAIKTPIENKVSKKINEFAKNANYIVDINYNLFKVNFKKLNEEAGFSKIRKRGKKAYINKINFIVYNTLDFLAQEILPKNRIISSNTIISNQTFEMLRNIRTNNNSLSRQDSSVDTDNMSTDC